MPLATDLDTLNHSLYLVAYFGGHTINVRYDPNAKRGKFGAYVAFRNEPFLSQYWEGAMREAMNAIYERERLKHNETPKPER